MVLAPASSFGGAIYWNVFNIEGESQIPAAFVTYATLSDMLTDANRLEVYSQVGGSFQNIVGSGSDGATYWNVFNIEGESEIPAAFVTYASLMDMLTDTNRLEVYSQAGGSFQNIVGSGSDGTTYWNVFNIEGESEIPAAFVTYASLMDMLTDTNRLEVYSQAGGSFQNIVGSGSDGTTYWNVFNIEGESQISADFVTYASLSDMLTDANRLEVYSQVGGSFQNIVGSGAAPFRAQAVPDAAQTLLLLVVSLGVVVGLRRRIR